MRSYCEFVKLVRAVIFAVAVVNVHIELIDCSVFVCINGVVRVVFDNPHTLTACVIFNYGVLRNVDYIGEQSVFDNAVHNY